jgi:hypothetical protein
MICHCECDVVCIPHYAGAGGSDIPHNRSRCSCYRGRPISISYKFCVRITRAPQSHHVCGGLLPTSRPPNVPSSSRSASYRTFSSQPLDAICSFHFGVSCKWRTMICCGPRVLQPTGKLKCDSAEQNLVLMDTVLLAGSQMATPVSS